MHVFLSTWNQIERMCLKLKAIKKSIVIYIVQMGTMILLLFIISLIIEHLIGTSFINLHVITKLPVHSYLNERK